MQAMQAINLSNNPSPLPFFGSLFERQGLFIIVPKFTRSIVRSVPASGEFFFHPLSTTPRQVYISMGLNNS
jgi:hypothetical protein